MNRLRPHILRAPAAVLLAAAALLSCAETATAPRLSPHAPLLSSAPTASNVVISQVYGGGGNSGATYKNDFIELFNPGAAAVSLEGWSVQYASATGTSWQVTPLSGMLQPGGYYLVRQAAGAGGTVDLPTPDATGSIPMSATAGKVWLMSSTTALTGACPTGAVDQVSFGTTASNCDDRGTTATLSNTTAAFRNNSGCAYTRNLLNDFSTGAPAPRNSASPTHRCGPSVVVSPPTVTLDVDDTHQFTASELDVDGTLIGTTFEWSTSDAAVASISETGLATARSPGTVTVTATASDGVAGTAALTVSAPPPPGVGDVVISQVYGGGGNSGATYRNDFVELFNRGTGSVTVTGWSVQYTSASGTSWQVTPLAGTIAPGAYYLVQQAAGAGGTTSLPVPEATGTIAMGATGGKVLLAATTAAASEACPLGLDLVPYGSANCPNPTGVLGNQTAALRRGGGCVFTGSGTADFITGGPVPRNGASQTRTCEAGVLDHVAISGATSSLLVGSTLQLTAAAQDGFDNAVDATLTWTTSSPAAASVDATGLVTGLAASQGPVTITATAVAGSITRSASVAISVTNLEIAWIDVSSSSTSMPPGFQTQLFPTARTASGGTVVPATFTFKATDPHLATIEQVGTTGLVTAVAAPADPAVRPGFEITATPVGGGKPYTFTTRSITVEVPVSAPVSIYANNAEFGKPTPASASNPNDFLIRRPQYTISYNQSRGTPNWVSYELDSRQMVSGQDRCNCFTADPLLPTKQITTADYTNGGYDRGHMARSADRTAGNVDNAITFYLTNIVPQTADLNQGVWAQFENALGDSARVGGRAVYIVTGPYYDPSRPLRFIKDEGKIAIPDRTWKVALIGPRSAGNPFARGDVQTWDDVAGLTILAASMPNVAGVRNDPWASYLTTVDKIEAATGYDFLPLLSTAFADALEANDRPPTAQFSAGGTTNEGSPITFDASGTTDPDLGRTDLGRTETLSYEWRFSDGTTATGSVVSKTFALHGSYTASLVVTDAFGWPATRSQSLTIANVPPAIGPLAGATILQGETYAAAGTFSDPGAGPWTATVDYGDGGGHHALALNGKAFALGHTYTGAGTFTVTVRVSDGPATGSRTATVVVQTPAQGIANLGGMVDALGTLDKGAVISLKAKLRAADGQLSEGEEGAAANTLGAFINELRALVVSDRLSGAAADPVVAYARRVIAAVQR